MIVRRCCTPATVLVVALTLLGGFDRSTAERWSRQVSNSDWIPLASPRTASGQVSQSNPGLLPSGAHLQNPVQTLALPPALQQQYQDQLIQLQKTQESIQKLLLLQQQLRAQQQVLQSQTFLPSGFGNEDEKQGLLPSSLGNLQTEPSSEALPPIYPSQDFLPHRPGQPSHLDQNPAANREPSGLANQGQVVLQHGENVEDPREGPQHSYVTKQGGQRYGGKRPKAQPNPELQQLPLIEGAGDEEEEEVQLVYVPAETLAAQRGQHPKRGRGRKPPYHLHQQQQQQQQQQQHRQRESTDNIEQAPLTADQEVFAQQVLQQIQKEHEEKAQFLKEERVKEFTRLNEEQKALERKTRLQQEALQREQELLRQREADKKRKELERLEETARQRELERIRDAREKQRQEELERRRLAELRVKEEKRRDEEARQKQLEQVFKQQGILESQQEHQLQSANFSLAQLHENDQAQALIREQGRRQQLTDNTRLKRIRGRQRQRVNQYQEQANYPEITTTPSPNQPPLSVYMGGSASKLESVKVTDVLKILKDAKTIAVLDNVGPDSPRVFVGPANLDPPYGYAKFDLPYLSSIDHNRVERKVDKLPFFVAPLSFDPPPGYSKIPFPAPHIGSVVVNTLAETSSESSPTEQNSNLTPLIEPNSYTDQVAGSVATTASYESPTTQSYNPESSGPKYESSYSTPASGSRFRFRQYYDNKPTLSSTYYGEHSTAKTKPRKQYYEQGSKSSTQSPKVDITASYRQEASYSNAPNYEDRTVGLHESSTKEQDLAAQLALINQEFAQQKEPQRYNAEQYRPQANLAEAYDVNDVRAPAQYNLPAELPPISPHLPGLVNSLLDKQEENLPVTSTPPTTTTTTPLTTTTTRVSSTTYRLRGRSRVVPTRAKTTTTPTSKTDRTRRPYSRSKSRFSTTTEEYQESSYEPTKAKIPETTQKYKVEHRRPTTSRTHKYRSRDRTTNSPTVRDRKQNVQAQQEAIYENYPTQSDSQSNTPPDAYSPPANVPISNLQEKEISAHEGTMSDFTRESYLPTTPTQTENYPQLHEVTLQHGAALVSDDYSRSQNYPQNRPQEAHYHDGFEQLEKTPVNGFNYQVGNEETPEQAILQRPKEYPRYQDKLEDAQIGPGEEQRYSPIYEAQPQQPRDYSADGQNLIRDQLLPSGDGKIESAVKTDPSESPIFVPLQHSKQEDYELRIPSSQTPFAEITTTSTTSPAPVIIRQRVRGRLGGRGHQEAAVQTRPRGSQDEYVRFSVASHEPGRGGAGQRLREGSRTRTRARPQSHGSQVQTEGNEYIKIHAAQQQRLIATTTTPTTTTVASTSEQPSEEEVDYGFIRPPSFQPVHSLQPVHPVDTRFQAPITYRPSLSEIQHLIANDETAVESSPTHVLKSRPKYQQTPSRRPGTKTFATTESSSVPFETTGLDDNAAYTAKQKTKPEETRATTRVRGRVRRPGKKRTTTTTTSTESTLEANNELPLDELNYPRITSQQFVAITEPGRQALYEEDFDPSQYVPSQNRPVQLYEETTGGNYPPQEFILNFDNLPEQVSQREKYDQSQLASASPKKYGHSSRANPTEDGNAHSSSDIYGAESQWSTKLSKTSFQPSFASNRAADGAKRGRGSQVHDNRNDNENVPEIITAGPDVSYVTMVVSSDYQKYANDDADAKEDDVFGRKTGAQEHAEKLNASTTVATSSPIAKSIRSKGNASSEVRDWAAIGKAKQADDDADTKKVTDPHPGKKGGTRRRRVRVRVRPVTEDFVTAESQHYKAAMNSLAQDRHKYNSNRESKFTTAQPVETTIATSTTTTAAPMTQKSLLQDFLEEMLKNGEVTVPSRVATPVTTDFPIWTVTTPMTTYPSANDEITTLKESLPPIVTTIMTPSIDDNERITTTRESTSNELNRATSLSPEQISQLSEEEMKDSAETKSEDYRAVSSQEKKNERNNLENVGMITQRYKQQPNYPNGPGTWKQVEDGTTRLPAAWDKGKEHIMTLAKPEENIAAQKHPKNHRAKWSEVRYPSTFDKPQQSTQKQQSTTTSIPGFTTRNEGESSVKTLSDYVSAIFDSMKNVDERGQEEREEVAKVVEAKSENSLKINNIASVRELNAKENATNPPEARSATTETTTFESTAPPIQETTVNASEETGTTKTISTAATSTEKATTSLGQPADNADRANATINMLGKVLRTSTTTRVSHMTEICYRGRCVMTKPKMDDAAR